MFSPGGGVYFYQFAAGVPSYSSNPDNNLMDLNDIQKQLIPMYLCRSKEQQTTM